MNGFPGRACVCVCVDGFDSTFAGLFGLDRLRSGRVGFDWRAGRLRKLETKRKDKRAGRAQDGWAENVYFGLAKADEPANAIAQAYLQSKVAGKVQLGPYSKERKRKEKNGYKSFASERAARVAHIER